MTTKAKHWVHTTANVLCSLYNRPSWCDPGKEDGDVIGPMFWWYYGFTPFKKRPQHHATGVCCHPGSNAQGFGRAECHGNSAQNPLKHGTSVGIPTGWPCFFIYNLEPILRRTNGTKDGLKVNRHVYQVIQQASMRSWLINEHIPWPCTAHCGYTPFVNNWVVPCTI